MSASQERGECDKKSLFSTLIQCLIFFLVTFLCVSEGVPGINESHYLPKAKHLWNSDFAPGDLFLQSHDSHFLASAVAGIAAQALSLDVVAWLGRAISWGLLAWAWLTLCRSAKLPLALRPFVLATWLLGVHFGNWAGEWVVGGFEAKTIAYPLVILGLAGVVAGQWKWVWVAMGGAMAWHPLVGGWAGLTAGIVWLWQGNLKEEVPKQLPWLFAGAALALVGVAPAALGLGGPDVIEKVSAAQVHVFMRLPHHLSPQLFAVHRHWAASISLLAFAFATILWTSSNRHSQSNDNKTSKLQTGLGRLLLCGWMSVIFALLGLAIDWSLSVPRPDIAAKLLRFYWFRWSDIAVPLVSSIVIWNWLAGAIVSSSVSTSPHSPSHRPLEHQWLKNGLLAVAIVATILAAASRLQLNETRHVPAADRLVVESVGRNAIDTERYVDWLAVCQWIRENSPSDSFWLTPKYQQSFKWHAQRAEVVCWKDVPQDNASVIEWYHRIQNCAPPRDRSGRIRDWTTEELIDLSAQYGFRWILLDRTYQSQPPALEIKYPVVENGHYIDNRSFAVLYIPDALLREKSK